MGAGSSDLLVKAHYLFNYRRTILFNKKAQLPSGIFLFTSMNVESDGFTYDFRSRFRITGSLEAIQFTGEFWGYSHRFNWAGPRWFGSVVVVS